VNVLIGDGQPVARLGLGNIIAALRGNVNVLEASTFSECLETIRKSGDLDLAVVDVSMSDMPWEQGIRRLREECDGVPIIAMAPTEVRSDIFKMIELGASGFLPKSASAEQLGKAVNLVLSGAVYLPKSVVTAPNQQAAAPALERGGRAISETALPMLTRRQREVLKLLAEGKRNSEIAEILGTSEFTVRVHVSAILKSLGVANRTQAALKAKDVLRDN
jgi:DNA-binding NarL/FixJ family response regulator